jgi:elongation factor P hydroxylase
MAGSIADDINFFTNNFTAEEAVDYSGVCDPDAFWSFQLAAAYCLTCSEDSSEGDYDPTRECFMIELADGAVEEV